MGVQRLLPVRIMLMAVLLVLLLGLPWPTDAFSIARQPLQPQPKHHHHQNHRQRQRHHRPSHTGMYATADTAAVETYLQDNHATFWRLIVSKNDKLWKTLRESSTSSTSTGTDSSPNSGTDGVTLFAPTDEAMAALGETRLSQLSDNRNDETVLRMGDFHAINEPVTADALYNSAGVVPVAQEVIPVDRTRTGGFMGLGGTEDGGFTVGGARVVETIVMGSSFIHRTDTLVSPSILWRYCDQLRIPGSK